MSTTNDTKQQDNIPSLPLYTSLISSASGLPTTITATMNPASPACFRPSSASNLLPVVSDAVSRFEVSNLIQFRYIASGPRGKEKEKEKSGILSHTNTNSSSHVFMAALVELLSIEIFKECTLANTSSRYCSAQLDTDNKVRRIDGDTTEETRLLDLNGTLDALQESPSMRRLFSDEFEEILGLSTAGVPKFVHTEAIAIAESRPPTSTKTSTKTSTSFALVNDLKSLLQAVSILAQQEFGPDCLSDCLSDCDDLQEAAEEELHALSIYLNQVLSTCLCSASTR